MCAPIGDGAAAAILCSDSFLKKHPSRRAVKILASVLQSGNLQGPTDVAARSAKKAYEAAGVGPGDINVAEVHDATAFGELHQVEQMGFCSVGEGGPFAEAGETSLGGKIPINTSGGLKSKGHPVGATGIAQAIEIYEQLRGESGERQVEGAEIGLAQNMGGSGASSAVHVFRRV